MPSSLQLVAEQFPSLRERVAGLYEKDVVFRELCDDYEVCSQTIGRQGTSADLLREFEALRLRLETELLTYLDADGASPGRRR